MAVWGCVPWLLLGLFHGLAEFRDVLSERVLEPNRLARLAAALYLPVGAVWALFDQLSYQPLGFSGVIVLLTGVHFHYAGFALPWLTSKLDRREAPHLNLAAIWGVIFGVPLVAIGITSSQLNWPWWVETGAVTLLGLSALVISVEYVRLGGKRRGIVRALFMLAGSALGAGMMLALLYGWRPVVALEWVTIPAMYTLHGTLNSWGFCLPGILGWKVLGSRRIG